MNFRKTAIALAVAGIAATPMAAQADVYASVRIGVWNVDEAGSDQLELRSFSSRFGAKGEADLGNGMTGFGKYEWDVDFNRPGETSFGIRHRIVGVKGDFGKVTLGQTYHTFYNYVVGPADIPWWHSGYAMISYRGRTDDALSYNYSSDAFNFGVSAYIYPDAAEDAIDQLEVAVSFGLGDMTLGIALQTSEVDDIGNGSAEDILGVSLSGISFGDVSLGLGLQTQDDDTSLVADFLIGDLYIHIEQESLDATSIANTIDQDRLGITLGYTQSLGKDTLIYYELHSLDNDTGNSSDDRTVLQAVLKYNIL